MKYKVEILFASDRLKILRDNKFLKRSIKLPSSYPTFENIVQIHVPLLRSIKKIAIHETIFSRRRSSDRSSARSGGDPRRGSLPESGTDVGRF